MRDVTAVWGKKKNGERRWGTRKRKKGGGMGIGRAPEAPPAAL